MKFNGGVYLSVVLLLTASAMKAKAEVVYTPVNVSLEVGEAYDIDLNHDGLVDFTLRSHLLQDHCQFGEGYIWTLSVTPGSDSAVAVDQSGTNYAGALHRDTAIDFSQTYYPSMAVMAQNLWGYCGTGIRGEWPNVPDRYLGFQFQDSAGNPYYGWAKVSTVAYVDQWNVIHASTRITGFAYEAISGRGILAGDVS